MLKNNYLSQNYFNLSYFIDTSLSDFIQIQITNLLIKKLVKSTVFSLKPQ